MNLMAFYHLPPKTEAKAELDERDGEITLRLDSNGCTMLWFMDRGVARGLAAAIEQALNPEVRKANGNEASGI